MIYHRQGLDHLKIAIIFFYFFLDIINHLRKIFEAKTIEDAISKKLTRVDGIPPKGALVLTDQCRKWVIGKAMGIAYGRYGIFLGNNGLETVPIEDINSSWVWHEV